MITFSPFRTRRLLVRLQELPIGDAIYLCKMRADMHQAGITEALRRICLPSDGEFNGQITNVRAWTVQERSMVIAHYLGHVSDEGVDFGIGEEGRFSDYIRTGEDFPPAQTDVCILEGDDWVMRPVIGADAEAIERLIVGGRMPPEWTNRHAWRIGAMAATMYRRDEALPDPLEISDSEYDDWLASRVSIFAKMPERAFIQLMFAFLNAIPNLDHLLILKIGDDGFVFGANGERGKVLPPSRFPVVSLLSESTASIFGKPD